MRDLRVASVAQRPDRAAIAIPGVVPISLADTSQSDNPAFLPIPRMIDGWGLRYLGRQP